MPHSLQRFSGLADILNASLWVISPYLFLTILCLYILFMFTPNSRRRFVISRIKFMLSTSSLSILFWLKFGSVKLVSSPFLWQGFVHSAPNKPEIGRAHV